MTDDIASLQIRVLTDQVESANRRLATLEATGERTEKSLTKMSKVNFTAIVGSLAALGISTTALAAAATKSARDWLVYDKAVREVNSITSQTRAEFTTMRRDVLDLSVAIGVDAATAAKGLYQALSAGVPRENSIEFLKVASKAAIAGVTTVDIAVDGLTNTINAFKIPITEAESVADKLFATVINGKTTFDELSVNLSKATVPAAALGINLDELLGVIVGITKQGTPTAEAFTQVKATITALLDPSDELNLVYKSIGVESGRAAIQQFGFASTLEAVRRAYDGNDAALVKALRSSEAYNGVLSVTGSNLREVKGATDAMKNSTGLMAGAYKENSATLENALTSLKASAIGLVETMEGSLGIIGAFTEALRGAAVAINALSNTDSPQLTSAIDAVTRLGADSPAAVQEVEKSLNKIQSLVKMYEESRERLIAKGVEPKEGGWLSFATIGEEQLNDATKEIARLTGQAEQLRGVLSKTTPEARQTAKALGEINDLQQQKIKGLITEAQFEAGRDKALAMLEREKTARQIINEGESRAAKEAQKNEEVETARRSRAIEQAKEEEEALKKKNKYLEKAAEQAKDLATTDRERLELQIRQVEETRAAGQITDEIATKAKANLEEQIRLLAERDAKKAGGGGGKGDPGFSALVDALPEINDPFGDANAFEYLIREEDEIRKSYERRREAILASTKLTESEKLQLLSASEERYKELMATADKERLKATLVSMADLLGQMAGVSQAFGEKGFKAFQALAIAQATVSGIEATIHAYKEGTKIGGPYVGAIYAAVAAATTGVQIGRIASSEYSGAYEHGGMIPAGKFGLVGESGPELVQGPAAVTSARTTAGMNGGHSGLKPANTIVNVHNYAGVTVETQETPREDQQKQLDIIIRKAVDAVASSIKTGQGSVPKAMETTYPLYRGRKS